MIMKYDKMVAITQAESQRKQIIIDMAMERTLVNAKTTIQELKLKIKKLEKENAELREELARVRKISKV